MQNESVKRINEKPVFKPAAAAAAAAAANECRELRNPQFKKLSKNASLRQMINMQVTI